MEIVYLKSQGFKNKDIEKIIGVTQKTIRRYIKLYDQGGIEALEALNYKGNPSKLNEYKEQIKTSLEERPVRTLKEAKDRIKEITGVDLSLTQIKSFLDKLGIKRRKVKSRN